MSEDLEKKEEKEEKKKETKAKTSKTNTGKTSTTKKTANKKDSSSKKDETVEKKAKRVAKKSDDKKEKASSRLTDLTELMERIEEETEKQVTKTRKAKEKDETNKTEKIEKIDENDIVKTKDSRKKSSKQKDETKQKDLTVKKNAKELAINSKKMEAIEEEIKKQTTISEEKKNKMNKIIFHNIAIASIIMLYFIFLILGYRTIMPETFMVDLQVFSIITIGITIIIFEKAYKKDNTEYAIHGIESLFLSIATLLSTYTYARYQEKFIYIMLTVCYIFAIYYVAKSIVIYIKMKSKALKRTNDIHKIAKS